MSNHIIKSNGTPAQDENNRNNTPQAPAEKQLIPKEGEEYLRESGKIEDYPAPDGTQARETHEAATYGMRRSYDSIY